MKVRSRGRERGGERGRKGRRKGERKDEGERLQQVYSNSIRGEFTGRVVGEEVTFRCWN